MSDKEARIAFEHRIAKACHMTYEEVTRRFNEYENITGLVMVSMESIKKSGIFG